MKRVLNSGAIRLPNVSGSEKNLLPNVRSSLNPGLDPIEYSLDLRIYDEIAFKFEIKAPLLTFLTFQDSNLGALNRLPELDHPVAYLPPQFYKKDDSAYTSMDDKSSNIYTTRLFNFYTAAFNFYNNLLRDGMCKEEASLVLPQGVFINFLWDITAQQLVEFIEKHYNDSPEIYGYCSTLVLYLEEHAPELTRWLKVNRWQHISL